MAVISYPCFKVVSPVTQSTAESNLKVYPGPTNGWTTWNSGSGEYTIQGKKWPNDTRLDCWGDPTDKVNQGNGATIRLNTGANHDCNCFWGASDASKTTERQVRGIHFRIVTNGAKFRPRITGCALRYRARNNAIHHVGLLDRWNASGNSKLIQYGGNLSTELTTWGRWYGVAKRDTTDGNRFHEADMTWVGVLFHFETTWKSGSAVNCDVGIKELTPICDADRRADPYYCNKYRVWGVNYT